MVVITLSRMVTLVIVDMNNKRDQHGVGLGLALFKVMVVRKVESDSNNK